MLNLAIGVFVLAAVFGSILLRAVLLDKPRPKPVIYIHGGLATLGILTIIYYIVQNGGSGPIVSLVIFVLAALGGLTMFNKERQNKPVSKIIAIVHPIAAITALVILILYVMQ